MLYWLLYQQLYTAVRAFNVFHYVTTRAMLASLTSLFLCIALGPWLIRKLRYLQIGQHIREDGPRSHMKKAGTPTMGGVLIIISIVLATLLWADLRHPYVWIALFALADGGGPKSHGSMFQITGSIGSSAFPSRVFKGMRMSGHMGDARITTRNLRILGVDKDENLLVVEGSVPGANGGYILINKAKKPPRERRGFAGSATVDPLKAAKRASKKG